MKDKRAAQRQDSYILANAFERSTMVQKKSRFMKSGITDIEINIPLNSSPGASFQLASTRERGEERDVFTLSAISVEFYVLMRKFQLSRIACVTIQTIWFQ